MEKSSSVFLYASEHTLCLMAQSYTRYSLSFAVSYLHIYLFIFVLAQICNSPLNFVCYTYAVEIFIILGNTIKQFLERMENDLKEKHLNARYGSS